VYNESVTTYNTLLRPVPYVFFSTLFSFQPQELFDAPEAETADVDVGSLLDGDTAEQSGAGASDDGTTHTTG
jgi:hypothetical protein